MTKFGEAFKAARKSGKSVFSFGGKKYTTKLKEETSSAKSKVPVPTPRPSTSSAPAKSAPSPSTSGGTKTVARQDYPRPAKPVGIATATSPIGRTAAKYANSPAVRTKSQGLSGISGSPGRSASAGPQKILPGPVPEGVWYARKGSAMSLGAARRANKPIKR